MAFNMLAVLKAALRATHGAEVEQALSSHDMASELCNMGWSLDVNAHDWQVFRLACQPASLPAMAAWLLDQACRVSLKRYANAPARRKPPKPPVKRLHEQKILHVAPSRLLAAQHWAAP